MKFCEAVEKLAKGSKITRQEWLGELFYSYDGVNVKSWQPQTEYYLYDANIMLSANWVDCDDASTAMTFCKMLQCLRDGKRVRMTDWDSSYLTLDLATGRMLLHSLHEAPFIPTVDDFSAGDWVEVKPV